MPRRQQDWLGGLGSEPCRQYESGALRIGCHRYGTIVTRPSRSIPDKCREFACTSKMPAPEITRAAASAVLTDYAATSTIQAVGNLCVFLAIIHSRVRPPRDACVV